MEDTMDCTFRKADIYNDKREPVCKILITHFKLCVNLGFCLTSVFRNEFL